MAVIGSTLVCTSAWLQMGNITALVQKIFGCGVLRDKHWTVSREDSFGRKKFDPFCEIFQLLRDRTRGLSASWQRFVAWGMDNSALMKIGFIGLGNVGGKLAGSLIRNGHDVVVRDLDAALVAEYVARGASSASSPAALGKAVDLIVTCLPSPAASSAVAEGEDGFLHVMRPGQVWLEMSTTDYSEIIRLGALVEARGAMFMECPVSGGCHRADTGNIAIFAGGPRAAFEAVLPVLTTMGRRILHTGDLGTASQLKVMTNYLCTVHLVALAEALTTCKAIGLDMNTTYEAIKISSGNSFVHETESQVILNGSRDINFTMDLVSKDIGLFDKIAQGAGVPVEMSPLIVRLFKEAEAKYGSREFSPNIIRRYEEPLGIKVLGTGFPDQMVDDEPEESGYEVVPKR
jgi:3-hydroxyisobutyrate dehydrogenase